MPTPYTGPSIVDYLTSTGQAADYASRARLAQTKGIAGYAGTAAQNTQLLNMLRGAGVPTSPTAPSASTTPVIPSQIPPGAVPSPLYQNGVMATPNPGITPDQVSTAIAGGWSPTVPTNTGTPQGTGTTPPPGTGATSPVSSTETSNELLDRLLKSLTPTTEETGLQNKLAELEAFRTTETRNIDKQPIAESYLGGQKTEVNKNINAETGAISPQLANLQAQRGAQTTALTTALGLMKPTQLPANNQLIDPYTGKVLAGAGGASDVQARDTFYNLLQSYPDAGIVYDPSKSFQENLTVAQQKVTNSPSFQAKQTVYAINPLTGEPTVINKRTGTSGWDTSSGGTSFGASAPSSAGGYKAGQLTALLQSKGMPTDDASLAKLYAQMGGQGQYVNDVAHNSQIYSAMTQGSAPQGSSTPAPSMNISQLSPELRAAYQDLGGVKFFDASKATTQQLPYLQRASQATGVPLLTKEDANAIQTSYQAVSSSGSLVKEIQSLVGNVINAPNDQGSMTKQAAYLTAIEKAPSLFTDNDAKAFISARNSVLSLITRAAGEKGTLTNQDVARISNALPSYGDNAELARQKAANLSQVLQAVYAGSVQAYIGGGQSGGSSGGSTYKGYTLPH